MFSKNRVIMSFVISAFLVSLLFSSVYAKTEKTLSKPTHLRPVGWQSGTVLFAAGFVAVDDADGGVVEGILGKNTSLMPYNWKSGTVEFMADKYIRFERAGGVSQGSLAKDISLRPAGWKTGSVKFMKGENIGFGYDGGVMFGTLAEDINLNSVKGMKLYKAGTAVTFTGDGKVK